MYDCSSFSTSMSTLGNCQSFQILAISSECVVISHYGFNLHFPRVCFSEKAMAPHSSTLAWRIPWTEEPGEVYSPRGRKELDTTEQLHYLSMACSWILYCRGQEPILSSCHTDSHETWDMITLSSPTFFPAALWQGKCSWLYFLTFCSASYIKAPPQGWQSSPLTSFTGKGL